MSRTMFDAVNVDAIPTDAVMVAGYVGGNWPTFTQLEARFPNAVRVSIAVNSHQDAQVLDVENGDASPADAPAWAQRQRARGQDPTIYTPLSSWSAVSAAFHAANVTEPWYWIAHYDGDPTIPVGAIAKQYRNDVPPGFDVSAVADHWPGIDPTPPAFAQEADDMTNDQAQQLAEVHDMLTLLTKGAPNFGIEPATTATSFTHRTVNKIADKLGVQHE